MTRLSTLLLLLVSCGGEDAPTNAGSGTITVGDVDDDGPSSNAALEHLEHVGSTACSETYSGPVLFDETSVACGGQDQVRFQLQTNGWTSGGVVYVMNTAEPGSHDEEHTLWIVDYDPCGFWDELSAGLTAGVDVWEVDRSTEFTCDAHFEAVSPKLTLPRAPTTSTAYSRTAWPGDTIRPA